MEIWRILEFLTKFLEIMADFMDRPHPVSFPGLPS